MNGIYQSDVCQSKIQDMILPDHISIHVAQAEIWLRGGAFPFTAYGSWLCFLLKWLIHFVLRLSSSAITIDLMVPLFFCSSGSQTLSAQFLSLFRCLFALSQVFFLLMLHTYFLSSAVGEDLAPLNYHVNIVW